MYATGALSRSATVAWGLVAMVAPLATNAAWVTIARGVVWPAAVAVEGASPVFVVACSTWIIRRRLRGGNPPIGIARTATSVLLTVILCILVFWRPELQDPGTWIPSYGIKVAALLGYYVEVFAPESHRRRGA